MGAVTGQRCAHAYTKRCLPTGASPGSAWLSNLSCTPAGGSKQAYRWIKLNKDKRPGRGDDRDYRKEDGNLSTFSVQNPYTKHPIMSV